MHKGGGNPLEICRMPRRDGSGEDAEGVDWIDITAVRVHLPIHARHPTANAVEKGLRRAGVPAFTSAVGVDVTVGVSLEQHQHLVTATANFVHLKREGSVRVLLQTCAPCIVVRLLIHCGVNPTNNLMGQGTPVK